MRLHDEGLSNFEWKLLMGLFQDLGVMLQRVLVLLGDPDPRVFRQSEPNETEEKP